MPADRDVSQTTNNREHPDLCLPEEFRRGMAFAEHCFAEERSRLLAALSGSVRPVSVVELPIQRATRERLIDGMCGIIRRMTRHTTAGILCLVDHDEREMAIELFSYLEGVRHHAE